MVLNAMFKVRAPESSAEFIDYYDLRWRILRAPWQQPRGSERDAYEENAIHAMALNEDGRIVGVARLHQINRATAQLRYMAVEEQWQQSGIGNALLGYLETHAREHGVRLIRLNARENSVAFYRKRGYQVTGPGHLLYGEIQHQKMQKKLD